MSVIDNEAVCLDNPTVIKLITDNGMTSAAQSDHNMGNIAHAVCNKSLTRDRL